MMNEATTKFPTWEELTRRQQLISMISDDYKSLYGFRPREDWSRWSDEELEGYHQSLVKDLQEELEQEKQDEEMHQEVTRRVMGHQPWTLGDLIKNL